MDSKKFFYAGLCSVYCSQDNPALLIECRFVAIFMLDCLAGQYILAYVSYPIYTCSQPLCFQFFTKESWICGQHQLPFRSAKLFLKKYLSAEFSCH
jgi:hypothetical protein